MSGEANHQNGAHFCKLGFHCIGYSNVTLDHSKEGLISYILRLNLALCQSLVMIKRAVKLGVKKLLNL